MLPSLKLVVLVSEAGEPPLSISVMALLDRGDELALDDSRSASAVAVLVILPASLKDGLIRTRQKNKEMVILGRIGVRLKIRRLIFAPFLGFARESGSLQPRQLPRTIGRQKFTTVDGTATNPAAKNPDDGIFAPRRSPLSSVMYQVVGSGSGSMVVVDLTTLVTAPLGPVVVLLALYLSGLDWVTTRR